MADADADGGQTAGRCYYERGLVKLSHGTLGPSIPVQGKSVAFSAVLRALSLIFTLRPSRGNGGCLVDFTPESTADPVALSDSWSPPSPSWQRCFLRAGHGI